MEPSVGIMDSQSVKWGNNVSLNGVNGNKKVKGVKCHVIVDKNGFLLTVMVTIVCVHDGKVVYLLARLSWGTLLLYQNHTGRCRLSLGNRRKY